MATLLDDNAVVVFQGDSITDCRRSRTDDTQLGDGYAGMVAAWFAGAGDDSGAVCVGGVTSNMHAILHKD